MRTLANIGLSTLLAVGTSISGGYAESLLPPLESTITPQQIEAAIGRGLTFDKDASIQEMVERAADSAERRCLAQTNAMHRQLGGPTESLNFSVRACLMSNAESNERINHQRFASDPTMQGALMAGISMAVVGELRDRARMFGGN